METRNAGQTLVSEFNRKMRRTRRGAQPISESVSKAENLRLLELFDQAIEKGYATTPQIQDHLPDDIESAEEAANVISGQLRDQGIKVFDYAPDRDDLIIQDDSVQVNPDSDSEELAEAAISSFVGLSRTHRPSAYVYARNVFFGTAKPRTRN